MLQELFELIFVHCPNYGQDAAHPVWDAADVADLLQAPPVLIGELPAFRTDGISIAPPLSVIRLALFGKHPVAIRFQAWMCQTWVPDMTSLTCEERNIFADPPGCTRLT